ncbi:MAG: hypothetical protein MJE77_21120 [Proteobacteria bacterium]|nr:hypothetical protein [Pseudomonadota bacterium]
MMVFVLQNQLIAQIEAKTGDPGESPADHGSPRWQRNCCEMAKSNPV